jgi:hypothetical protein
MGIRASGPHFPTGLQRPTLISGSPDAGPTCHAITPPSSQSLVRLIKQMLFLAAVAYAPAT